MHSAPSVTYPVGRSSFAALVSLSLWAAAAAATCAWWLNSPVWSWRLAVALLLLIFAGVWAVAGWWRSPSGELGWTAEGWAWSLAPSSGAGTLRVGLDFQQWMLVRWMGAGRSHWLWLERGRCAERWNDLRRAVYSHANSTQASAALPAQAGKP
jgi:toxin CptA